jgi:hypothetical protein
MPSIGRRITSGEVANQLIITRGGAWHSRVGLQKGAAIMPIRSPLLRVLWTLLAVVSSYPVLGVTTGSAAWNGVNFAVCLYLIASAVGSIWPTFGALFGVLSAEASGMDHVRRRTGHCCIECDLRRWIHLRSYTRGPIKRPNVLRQISCADTLALRFRVSLLPDRGSAVLSRQ